MTALRILVVVALQTAALAYMIVDRQAMLNASRVVTLKVGPIDPRDPFRGDYVILRYAISTLDLNKLDGDDTVESGDTIYVTLQQKDAEWAAVSVAHKHPLDAAGSVTVRGTVTSADSSITNHPPDNVRVDYGIESYFVPEGTGQAIEQERQKGDLSADIAVDASGRTAIKALRRNGQVFYTEGIL
jgi:uncharacterized membrane-anchored protein